MNQLMDRLADFGEQTTTGTPSDDIVAADLRRARAGLAHRRQKIGAASLAVLAVAGVGIAGASGALSSGRSPTTPQAASAPMTTAPLKLVAYTGKQPNGFHIATVPQGYSVDHSTASLVVLAPTGQSVYGNKHQIAIYLINPKDNHGQLKYETTHAQPVEVAGHQGYYKVNKRDIYVGGPGPGGVVKTTDYLTSVTWNNGTYWLSVASDVNTTTKAESVQIADGVTTVGHPKFAG